jgi:hypothetical protein
MAPGLIASHAEMRARRVTGHGVAAKGMLARARGRHREMPT